MMALTMFNSQKINTDPTPLYTVLMIAQNGRTAEWSMRATSDDVAIEVAMNTYPRYDVHTVNVTYNRPEFDNNPNPILEHFRDAMQTGEYELVVLATIWESLIDTGYDWEEDDLAPTLEELDHARKVLERLAALTER